jgi:hypothetical protein
MSSSSPERSPDSWPTVLPGSRYFEQFASGRNRNLGVALGDHFLFLRPVKFRAGRLDKKPFPALNLPITRYNSATSASWSTSFFFPLPKRFGAFSSRACFQLQIWLGCTLYALASSASVLEPDRAARATLALNAAL